MAAVTRSDLVATLQRALHAIDDVDAAWEGGSAAFASDDALSDVRHQPGDLGAGVGVEQQKLHDCDAFCLGWDLAMTSSSAVPVRAT